MTALVAAAVVFAGCNAGVDAPDDVDDVTDPTDDGAGGGDGGAGGDGGDGTGDGGDQAYDQDSDPEFPGLVLDGTMDPQADNGSAVITASVRNNGNEQYRITNICVEPWSENMTMAGEPVQHREPMVHCMAFGLGTFENDTRIFAWNRTVWEEDATGLGTGHYVAAAPGDYIWQVHYRVYKGGTGPEFDQATTLSIGFTVTVD